MAHPREPLDNEPNGSDPVFQRFPPSVSAATSKAGRTKNQIVGPRGL